MTCSAEVTNYQPNHVRHLAGGAIVGTVMCLFLYFYLTADRPFPIPIGLDAIFTISGFFAFVALLISYSMEHIACLQNEYKKALKSYHQGELIKLSKSPELNETEQKLVI